MGAGSPPTSSGRSGGPIGYWKFDEGYGQTANNSGNGGSALNGTLGATTGSSTDDPSWSQAGKFGKALSFDGGDYVNLGSADALEAPTITVTAWAKRNAIGARHAIVADSVNSGSDKDHYLWFEIGLDNKLAIMFGDGTNYGTKKSSRTIADTNWHQVAVVRDNTAKTLQFFIDGIGETPVAYAQTTGTLTTLGSNNLFIGRSGYISALAYFNGLLDEVKIYPYALTSDEVKLDYNRGSALVLGAAGTNSSYAQGAANQEYCIPGDTTSCAAPVGRWDFEEGSGTAVNDTSGNGNLGTWNGSGTTHWISGKYGKAGNFDGSTDFVNSGNGSSLSILNDITLEAWVKVPSNLANYKVITSKYSSDNDNGWQLDTGASGKPRFITFNTTGSSGATSTGIDIRTNSWHHIVGVASGTNAYIYVDGVLSGSGTAKVRSAENAYNVDIGRRRDGNYLTGLIDQVRIFNYARTPAQIAWDYNRGAPVGWWKFDECQGSVAHDSTLNNNHGTITIGASGTQTQVGTCTTSGTAWGNGVTGKRNASLNFDGTDDYVSIGDPANGALDFGTGDLSISAWTRYTSSSGTARIMAKRQGYNGDGTDKGFELYRNGGRMQIFFGDATGQTSPSSTSTNYNDGNWHLVVVTLDRDGNASFYKDGRADGSGSISSLTSSISNTASLYVGSSSAPSGYFTGQIDDVRVYNYALTGTQVKNLYNCDAAVCWAPSTGAP